MTRDVGRSRTPRFAAVAVAVLAASCAWRPGPDRTRFHVLPATVPDAPRGPDSVAVGLGPIVMPGYLQHPSLATRVGAEVRYAAVDRWAEPLPTLFGRALGQDLSALLGVRVVPYPWYRATPLALVVRVDVTSFETDAAGNATLDACWSVRDAQSAAACREECSSIVEPVERGPHAHVAALGRAVERLAQRMDGAIRSCPSPARLAPGDKRGRRPVP